MDKVVLEIDRLSESLPTNPDQFFRILGVLMIWQFLLSRVELGKFVLFHSLVMTFMKMAFNMGLYGSQQVNTSIPN